MQEELSRAFLRMVKIMDELREQCPWDRKQTIHTLRQLTIEETYELADAITESDWKSIKEELGDLLLHILFYAKIGSEQKQFELKEVLDGIAEKLIFRHPHIYSDVKVNNEEDVKQNWEKLKLKEGKKSVLSGVPKSLPSTVKAMRLQEKAKQVGFEWDNKEQVWEKVEEEMEELKQAISNRQLANESEREELQVKVEEEFGDVIFSLINYARFLRVDAENALELTNKKFIQRFTQMEEEAMKKGRDLNDMTLEEMDSIWNEIKRVK
ncbi:MAG: nucleoside triphosphate pyrophosphohydrolase [Sphingobacteriales bacterium]|nr:nucleoside triphosphate pyrophosphohydrolase [Sphingobacteriales bacterium]MBI3720123.1 nucleoside triphosphate pyrophosphohydrolase [Sphingobacteriales bacterium]